MENRLTRIHRWVQERLQWLMIWRKQEIQVQERMRILEKAGIFARSTNVYELVQQYSAWSGTPIHILPQRFRVNIDALVMPRRTHFTIYFAATLHPLTGMHAIRHELAHIDLGDVRLSPDDVEDDALTERDLLTSLKREAFTHAYEVRAERWAYLAQRVWQREQVSSHSTMGLTDDAGAEAWKRFETYMAPLDPPEA